MSDIYDYAYIHVMRQPAEINNYSTAPRESYNENEVNTSDFSQRDLQIFVDSLETITRLERRRLSKRSLKRNLSYEQAMEPSNQLVTCLDTSIEGSIGTTVDEDAKSLYNYSESDYLYDETYYGMLPSIGQSSTIYSNIEEPDAIKLSNSDSEESGVFFNHTSDDHEYENIDPIRPRSKMISHQKSKSLKSRLIALIMKNKYVHPDSPSVEFLSSTTIGEQTQESEIYDRIMDDVIQHQFVKNSKKGKKKYKDNAAKKRNETATIVEENFLEKAMRFLTM